ncbi:DUF4383 domain-containing protein [Glycomyces salinus]|uniref:DUF4383 domain-containing protein n=1 Tax=Glycomyces salinus TaxID=980294 RepID=UPI0018EA94FD|nr:DUF4383 domain-containing protein [Glycomyces salinus]
MTPLQDAGAVIGLVFVLVGALGFLPGITTGIGSLEIAGSGSEAMLFGIFQVSVLLNLLHIGIGAIGMLMSWFLRGAIWFLTVGGIAYLALGVYGLLVPDGHVADFVPLNLADDILHLASGVVMLVLMLTLPRHPTPHSSGEHILGPS